MSKPITTPAANPTSERSAAPAKTDTDISASGCCDTQKQSVCCEPSEKSGCCGPENPAVQAGGCGCQ